MAWVYVVIAAIVSGVLVSCARFVYDLGRRNGLREGYGQCILDYNRKSGRSYEDR
jgi:hypothetical protein